MMFVIVNNVNNKSSVQEPIHNAKCKIQNAKFGLEFELLLLLISNFQKLSPTIKLNDIGSFS